MTQTDRKLLAELREKLGSSPQALSQRRQRLQRKVAMPTDIATYVIAHREGIRIDRYLDPDTVDRVNEADRRLEEKQGGPAPQRTTRQESRARTKTTKQMRFSGVAVRAGSLSERHLSDAEKMAGTAYPVIYVFENSVREFLDGHLTQAYGRDWFTNDKIVAGGVRQTVERNREAEAKARYHSQRNARPIYYTNLDDLSRIVRSENGWKVFKDIFPRDTWFPELVSRFEVSRNIVAHMNPLRKRDIRRLEDGLEEWLGQVANQQASPI